MNRFFLRFHPGGINSFYNSILAESIPNSFQNSFFFRFLFEFSCGNPKEESKNKSIFQNRFMIPVDKKGIDSQFFSFHRKKESIQDSSSFTEQGSRKSIPAHSCLIQLCRAYERDSIANTSHKKLIENH